MDLRISCSVLVVTLLAAFLGECDVTPPPPPPPSVANIEITPSSAELSSIDATRDFSATAEDQDGNEMSDVDISWSISPDSVGSVDGDGTVTAAANGSATLEAEASGVSGTAELTVDQTVARVRVAPDTARLASIADSQRFEATPADANGHPVRDASVAWSARDTSVAVVDSTGTVYSRGQGTTWIDARSGQHADSAAVMVQESTLTATIERPSADSVELAADSLTLKGNATDPEDGALTGDALVWESSVDGRLGTGDSIAVALSADTTHTISLTATDTDGNSDADSVVITVPCVSESTVSLNQTVCGSIASPGEVDEFTFHGEEGDTIAAFLQGRTGSSGDDFELRVLDPSREQLGETAKSDGDDRSLLDSPFGTNSTGRIVLEVTGTHTVEVRDSDDTSDQGPYRFHVDEVDPRPETISGSISIGDTVAGEELHPAGDVDEFSFEGTAGDTVAIFLQGRTGSSADEFRLQLLNPIRDQLGKTAKSHGEDTSLSESRRGLNSTGRIVLPSDGTYTVVVLGREDDEDDGAYRFHVDEVDPRPETISGSIAIGDTVAGEELHPAGDVDEFSFQGMAGDTVAVVLQGRSGDSGDNFRLLLLDPSRSQLGETARSHGEDESLSDTSSGTNSTGRVELPSHGTYTVVVRGYNDDEDDGVYRFVVEP